MLRDIYLHGAPGRKHGRRWRLDVASPAEAVRALITMVPELREVFRKSNWRVIVGRPHIANGVDARCLNMNMGRQPLHIVPTTRPAGDDIGSIAVIVVGVIIIAVASYFTFGAAAAPGASLLGSLSATSGVGLTYGSLLTIGVALTVTGVMGLLAASARQKAEASTDQAAPDDRPSFYFNGVTNNTQQGGPVPLVFGTHLVGSVVIYGGLNAEQIPA